MTWILTSVVTLNNISKVLIKDFSLLSYYGALLKKLKAAIAEKRSGIERREKDRFTMTMHRCVQPLPFSKN